MYSLEIWKPIPGIKHYEASNLGRVRMLTHKERTRNRWGPMERIRMGKILRQNMRGDYLAVSVRNCPESVHRLVALAFHGLPPEGHVVNHKNGIKEDNTPKNLEWVTVTENIHHCLYVLYGKEKPAKPRSAKTRINNKLTNLTPWNKGRPYPNIKGKKTRKRNYLALCDRMLNEYESGGITQDAMASKYGVSRRTICERLRAAREKRNDS